MDHHSQLQDTDDIRSRVHARIEELRAQGEEEHEDELRPLLERLVSLLDPQALAPDSEDSTWSRTSKSFASKYIW